MSDQTSGHDGAVDPSEIRRRRESLGLSQRELGKQAGRGLSTIQDFELGRHVSAKSKLLIAQAMDALERKASEPKVETVTLPVVDLQAVIDELRALRRLHEETRARVEVIASRIEGSP